MFKTFRLVAIWPRAYTVYNRKSFSTNLRRFRNSFGNFSRLQPSTWSEWKRKKRKKRNNELNYMYFKLNNVSNEYQIVRSHCIFLFLFQSSLMMFWWSSYNGWYEAYVFKLSATIHQIESRLLSKTIVNGDEIENIKLNIDVLCSAL